MDILNFMAGLIAVAMAVLFFVWQPKYVDKQQLKVFNIAYILLVALLVGVWLLRMGTSFDPLYNDYKKTITFVGSFAIIAIGLLIGALIRNLFIFRPPPGPGGGYF